jgi:hypothetical protein
MHYTGIIIGRNGKTGALVCSTLNSDYKTPEEAMGSCDAYAESTDFPKDFDMVGEGGWLEDCYVAALPQPVVDNCEMWVMVAHILANANEGYCVGVTDEADVKRGTFLVSDFSEMHSHKWRG